MCVFADVRATPESVKPAQCQRAGDANELLTRARSRRPRLPHSRENKRSLSKARSRTETQLAKKNSVQPIWVRSAAARKSGEKLKVTQAHITRQTVIIITMRINNRVLLWEFVWSVFTAVTSLPFTCSLCSCIACSHRRRFSLFSNKLLCSVDGS
jgi:hypothetical protein